MGDVVNLRSARKQRDRAAKSADAAANRALHGQTPAQRELALDEARRREQTLNNARRDADGTD